MTHSTQQMKICVLKFCEASRSTLMKFNQYSGKVMTEYICNS